MFFSLVLQAPKPKHFGLCSVPCTQTNTQNLLFGFRDSFLQFISRSDPKLISAYCGKISGPVIPYIGKNDLIFWAGNSVFQLVYVYMLKWDTDSDVHSEIRTYWKNCIVTNRGKSRCVMEKNQNVLTCLLFFHPTDNIILMHRKNYSIFLF